MTTENVHSLLQPSILRYVLALSHSHSFTDSHENLPNSRNPFLRDRSATRLVPRTADRIRLPVKQRLAATQRRTARHSHSPRLEEQPSFPRNNSTILRVCPSAIRRIETSRPYGFPRRAHFHRRKRRLSSSCSFRQPDSLQRNSHNHLRIHRPRTFNARTSPSARLEASPRQSQLRIRYAKRRLFEFPTQGDST